MTGFVIGWVAVDVFGQEWQKHGKGFTAAGRCIEQTRISRKVGLFHLQLKSELLPVFGLEPLPDDLLPGCLHLVYEGGLKSIRYKKSPADEGRTSIF